MIAFSQPGKTTLIDIIPLFEISAVRDVSGTGQGQWANFWGHKRDSDLLNSTRTNGSWVTSDGDESAPVSAIQTSTPVFSNSRNNQFQDAFTLETIPDGHNSGRTYHLRAGSQERSQEVVASLKAKVEKAQQEIHARDRFQRNRERLRRVYDSRLFQYTVAALILTVHWPTCGN